ncbi:hypothetical protein DYI23_05925 [Roseibium polysiphoniae]|uniref:Uncharacterized protein n=1 Tax=Roseibium polysiphoniae TaxID=2571221 RepID=A0A944CC76_9HYPH|nr:hypothetical protein [Roseibium polysiphoniae]MBS8259752.1 hypothetical protein [Roseibium polysiphoniae]
MKDIALSRGTLDAAREIYKNEAELSARQRLAETLLDSTQSGTDPIVRDLICLQLFGHNNPETLQDNQIELFLIATDLVVSFAKFSKEYPS